MSDTLSVQFNSTKAGGGGGGGGSLPLKAVPDAREKKRVKRVNYPNQGWARNAKRVSKRRKMGEKGIQIAMIRILAMRSNMERVLVISDNMYINFDFK